MELRFLEEIEGESFLCSKCEEDCPKKECADLKNNKASCKACVSNYKVKWSRCNPQGP